MGNKYSLSSPSSVYYEGYGASASDAFAACLAHVAYYDAVKEFEKIQTSKSNLHSSGFKPNLQGTYAHIKLTYKSGRVVIVSFKEKDGIWRARCPK